jgi:hypothetical protein
MIQQEILDEMYNCLDYADLKGFEVQVLKYLKTTDESTASQELAMFLVNIYTAARADTIAKLMEIIIKCNPELALINYPENHFFRIIMISGSIDLFECFTEEAIEPHLKDASKLEQTVYYTKLLHLGVKLNKMFTDQYQILIKGRDFNGAFGTDENNENVKKINQEDYEIMNDIVDKYNTIIGRINIIKALMAKAEIAF